LKKQTQKATFMEEQLEKLSKDHLIEIIMELLKKNKKNKAKLLEMLGKYLKDNSDIKEVQEDIYLEQYEEYWAEADPILHDFNEYGGGPEEDEEIVYDNIDKIVALFKEHKLPQQIKIEFIDNLFYYYDLGNSGFDDCLMDAIFAVASSKSDWEYVIEKLRAEDSSYRKSLIMTIYKRYLHDDTAYLKEREAQLYYGMDYYDLCQFWYQKGEVEKAVEIAKQGLEKGEGRIIDLIEFLVKYYKDRNDYDNTLKYMVWEFKDQLSFAVYKETQKFCHKKDWPKIEAEYINILKEKKAEKQLNKIYLDKKEYDKVLEYVKSKSYFGTFYDDREEFAEKLQTIYPSDIIDFYKEKVQTNINLKSRKGYSTAVQYAKKIKHIYIDILKNKEDWENYIRLIRNRYPNYPALQEEFSKLG